MKRTLKNVRKMGILQSRASIKITSLHWAGGDPKI